MTQRISDYVCFVESEVRHLLNDGRRAQAIDLAISHLRSGYHHKLFLRLVADLLELNEKRKAWPRPKGIPKGWFEIGKAYEELRELPCSGCGSFRQPLIRKMRIVKTRKPVWHCDKCGTDNKNITDDVAVSELQKRKGFPRNKRTIKKAVSIYQDAVREAGSE
jgi:hypothetical protein